MNYEMLKIENPVGAYDWGGVLVQVHHRPNRFQRLMIKWFFGWGWVEND